ARIVYVADEEIPFGVGRDVHDYAVVFVQRDVNTRLRLRCSRQDLASLDHNCLPRIDRKSTRLNSSHEWISYAVFCLKKKTKNITAVIVQDNQAKTYTDSTRADYTHNNQTTTQTATNYPPW